ncbi:MAG TPA: hypothetical protein GXZ96_04875 [Firmicutes bacterium]|nr:hypothetical protein [Bacillota bacterium]
MGFDAEKMNALRERVRHLESTVARLRLSRRVLINLLMRQEKERQIDIGELRSERDRLRMEKARIARALWERNREICWLRQSRAEPELSVTSVPGRVYRIHDLQAQKLAEAKDLTTNRAPG